MTDNAPASSHMYGVGSFGHGGVAPSYNGIGDQHATTMVRPCSDFPQYGTQYSQFGQGHIRPGYSVGPVIQKEGMIPNRQSMAWGAVGGFQSGCPPGQHQRYMPSSSMPGPQQQPPPQQQQLPPGSAPTLNQLLQGPNSDQRYPGMYGEYVSGHPKTSGAEDVVGPSGGYGVLGWAGQQRMAMGAYQQQMMCSPMAAQSSPNQGVAIYDLNRRPSMGMGSRYPPPHPAPPHHGGGTALQNPAQYLSNSQPNSTMNQLGGQMQQSFSPNHSLPPAAHLQPSPSTTPQSQHSDHSSSNIKAQSSPQSMPTAKHKTKKQLKQRQKQIKPQTNVQEDSVGEDAYTDSGTGHHNTGSNSLHHAVGSQHPNAAPSPAGSVGSRSNTPASLSGNMVGSPSTNQHDGQNRILSPLHSQGGSGHGAIHNSQQQTPQMMPPPSMCPSHPSISSGSSKMHVPHGMSDDTGKALENVTGSQTPNMIPGYNGGHPDLINGPSNHIPSGMSNRIPNYPGSYGSGMDSSSMGQFDGGYGMHPVAVALGMSTSGTITSSADAGYHPSSVAAERSGVNGKSSASSSIEDASFSSWPLSLSADVPQPPLGNSMMGRSSHSSGIDGGGHPGRNPYGMPPSYEMAGLSQQQQQQQQHMMMSFGKPFPHGMTPHPGPGAFTRDHSAGGAPFDTGKALENVTGMASAAGSAGLSRDKSDYSHQFENTGRNSISNRGRPRIYDEAIEPYESPNKVKFEAESRSEGNTTQRSCQEVCRFKKDFTTLQSDLIELRKKHEELDKKYEISERSIKELRNDILILSMNFLESEDRLKKKINKLQKERDCESVIFLLKDFETIKTIARKISSGQCRIQNFSLQERLSMKYMNHKRFIGHGIQGLINSKNGHGHRRVSMSTINQCKQLASKHDVFRFFKIKGATSDILRFAQSTKAALKTVQQFVKYHPQVGMSVGIKYGNQASWIGRNRRQRV